MSWHTSVYPDFGAVAATGELSKVIGALLIVILISAVLMLIVCAIAWAFATAHGNYQLAARAWAGLLTAIGAAALAGSGVAWLNFLLGIGVSL